MRATAVAVLVATLVHGAQGDAKCKVEDDVPKWPEYQRCSDATGYVVTNRRGIDLPAFCSNADCQTYWTRMDSSGNLQCFQYSGGGDNVLKSHQSGTDCFKQYMAGAAPPSSPTVTTATPSTPSSTSSPSSPSSPTSPSSPSSPSTPSSISSPSTPSSPSSPSTPSLPSSPSSPTSPTSPTSPSTPSSSTNGADGNAGTSDLPMITSTTPSPARKPLTSLGDGKSTDDTQEKVGTAEDKTNTRPSGESKGGGQEDAVGTATKSTTAGSGSATTGNDSTKKKNAGPQSGSRPSGSLGGGGGGGNGTSGSSASSVYMVTGGSGSGVVLCIAGFLYFRKRADRAADAKNLDTAPDLGGYLPTLQSSRSRSSSAESLHVMGNTGVDNVVIQSKAGFWEDEAITAARIPFEKLKRGTLLSRGGYGEVYRGTYRGENVAIKTLLRERRKDLRQIEKFLTEVKLMATLEHDHIVRFVGVAWDSLTELCVVSEFMGGGDLRTLLLKYNEDSTTHPKGFNADKIKIALHVSHALTFMHSLQPAVLHRDLKSRNILLDTDLNAKLTDFGVSREQADSTMTVGVGSSLWIAPEVMTDGYYDEKADVFSFGVVLSELDTHHLPYSHAVESGRGGRKLPDAVIVQMMTTNRITVEFTDEEESPMAQLGRRCVAVDPADRPTTAEVQHQIHQLSRGSL